MTRGRPSSYSMKSREECIQTLWQVYREEGEIAQTARHYYYGLKRRHMIELDPHEPNSGKNAYKGVIRLLASARKNKLFPYSAVIDTSRRSLGVFTGSESLQSYIGGMGYGGYRLDPWRGQPRRIEVFTEKDGMANFLSNAVYKWRIPVYVNKGYASISMLREAAIRYQDGSKWLLLYVGDFDPSGLDIQRALLSTIHEHGGKPLVERVALVQADLATLDPLEQLTINPKDTRKRAFEEQYGAGHPCYQVESMPAGVLKAKVQQVVKAHMDEDKFNEALQLEEEINRRAELALKQSVETFLLDVKTSSFIQPHHQVYLDPPKAHINRYDVEEIEEDDEESVSPPQESLNVDFSRYPLEVGNDEEGSVVTVEAMNERLDEMLDNLHVEEISATLDEEEEEWAFCDYPDEEERETKGLLVFPDEVRKDEEYTEEMSARFWAYLKDKRKHPEWHHIEYEGFFGHLRVVFRPPKGYKPAYAFSKVFPPKKENEEDF